MRIFENFILDLKTYMNKENFPLPPDFERNMLKCTKIKIQNVADYYFTFSNMDVLKSSDIPNIMPPWKIFWMEYTLPGIIRQNDKIIHKELNQRFHFGALFFSEPSNSDILHLKSFASIYTMKFEKVAMLHLVIGVSKTGNIVDVSGKNNKIPEIQVTCMPYDLQIFDANIAKMQGKLLGTAIQPCYLAICFCHCKNTTIIKNCIDPALLKLQERKGRFPVDKFYTLDISPLKKVLNQSMNKSSSGLKMALHICRGHFKDFSDKGLFGKYKGLYWWDMQLRGDSKKGEIIKDYSVSATRQPE